MPNWGIFLLNGSPLGRSQSLHVREDAAQRKKLLEPKGSFLQGLRNGRISQALPAVHALRKATCHMCGRTWVCPEQRTDRCRTSPHWPRRTER